MKDIDFDELDRAVSSVLGQKTTNVPADSNSGADKKDEPVSVQDSGEDETPQTELSSTNSSPAEEPVTVEPAATPLAIKRRGKFMDVMHPSADMKPVGAASVKPVRPKPVLTPLLTEEAESTVEHTAEPTASLDESHSLIGAEPSLVTETLPETTGTEESDASVSHDMDMSSPASLEVPDDSEVVEIAADARTEAVSDDLAAEESSETTQSSDSPAPQATPFLSDTQVEKRPLGAFGEAEAPHEAEESAGPTDMQTTPVVSLPRELQPDVVGVESVQATETLEAPVSASASPFAANVPVAPEASDGRVEGHPLFDTSTYHEPIAAVHHDGLPGWAKWVIGLVACLAVGAGVGYFLFTAGL